MRRDVMCRDVCSACSGVGRRNFPEPVAYACTTVCALLELMMTYIFGYHGASLLVKEGFAVGIGTYVSSFEVARDGSVGFSCVPKVFWVSTVSVGVAPVEPGTNSTSVEQNSNEIAVSEFLSSRCACRATDG